MPDDPTSPPELWAPGDPEFRAPGDPEFWDARWSAVLPDYADAVPRRPPNPLLNEVADPLAPGRALDAGCGNGTEAIRLAAHGWEVTAVDFSAPAGARWKCPARRR
jgi:SAM-dependent methyltransferase